MQPAIEEATAAKAADGANITVVAAFSARDGADHAAFQKLAAEMRDAVAESARAHSCYSR